MTDEKFSIVPYSDRYREEMLSMVAGARRAMGLPEKVREDLYDVGANYLSKGDGFFLALDQTGRVAGCLGFSRIPGGDEAFLHRFYVRAGLKRRGIGTLLLERMEKAMREKGIALSRVHLGGDPGIWFESYAFYPKHGYRFTAPRYMEKRL